MKISIIIPVYNVEIWVDRAIKSALIQNDVDIEIVIVNDGSTDNSSEICRRYERENKNIKLIEKENGGLSDARNIGVLNASGDYILFLDSDDSLIYGTLKGLCEIIEKNGNPDIALVAAKQISKDSEIILKHYIFDGVISGQEYLSLYEFGTLRVEAWLCCCKREFILINNLFFQKGLLHEDVLWFPLVMLSANTVVNINLPIYNYFIREDSIMTKKNKVKNYLDIIFICEELSRKFVNIEDKLKIKLNDFIANYYMNASLLLRREDLKHIKMNSKAFLQGKCYFRKTKRKAFIYRLSPMLFWYYSKIIIQKSMITKVSRLVI